MYAKKQELLLEAINEGIDSNAVKETLSDMLNTSDRLSVTPKQIATTVITLSDMKNMQGKETNVYNSNLLNSQSNKIIRAIEDGISKEEITVSFNNALATNTLESKNKLGFMTNFVCLLKNKELKLRKSNELNKEQQKVKIKLLDKNQKNYI